MFFAFYYNNLFPEQVVHISRSIELILGPIIGGIGTLFGPIVGAFLLTGLAEALHELLTAFGIDVAGRQAGVLRRLPAAGRDGAAATASGRRSRARSASTASASRRRDMTALLEVDGISQALPRPARRRTT